MHMLFFESVAAYILGGLVYGAMELVFRGFTHMSMVFTGGACMLCFHLIYRSFPGMPLALRSVLASLIITAFEFAVGWLVNIRLGLNVWSYSQHPFNLMGQVCLLFSCIWFFMAVPMSAASRMISRMFQKQP